MEKDGKPSRGNNANIIEAMNANPAEKSTRLLASLPNFEEAYFGETVKEEKPYNALKTLEVDEEKFDSVETLLRAPIDFGAEPPINCCEWTNIEGLEESLNLAIKNKTITTINI